MRYDGNRMMMNNAKAKQLKNDFPILRTKEKGKEIVYLDNAATTQKPLAVIGAVERFYLKDNANIHRGVYSLSQRATQKYEDARRSVAEFINADSNEIIFTRGATESLNMLSHTALSLVDDIKKNEIVLSEMEHHSNLVPWQQLAKRKGMTLRFIKVKEDYTLDMGDAEKKITEKAAVVSVTHVSNALGTINDIKKIVKIAKKNSALSIIDAAQSAPHMAIDVKDIGCDFLVFSGHKMLGPTGIGVLYGKKSLLERMDPYQFGGDMIRTVSFEGAEWNDVPAKFEAGTPNLAGAAGLAEAVQYLRKIGMDSVEAWEHTLLSHALGKMRGIRGISIYNPGKERSAGIVSFNLKGVHPHDVSSLLDDSGICIRGGHHCAMPLMKKMGVSGTCRASFYIYNTMEDIDKMVEALKKVQKMFA